MAKGKYVGVDGVARKVKKQYVGVDGVARKIKKGYVGVDGVARQYWSSEPYLYNSGDLCTSITGGWKGRGWKPSWATQSYTQAVAPTVTNNTTGKYLEAKLASATYYRYGVLETVKDIDMTGKKTLTVTFSSIQLIGAYSVVRVDVGSRNTEYQNSVRGLDVATGDGVSLTNHTITLDVSGLSGSYDVYIALTASANDYTSNASATVQISSILLT